MIKVNFLGKSQFRNYQTAFQYQGKTGIFGTQKPSNSLFILSKERSKQFDIS